MNAAAVIFDMDGLLFDTERLYLEQSAYTEKEFEIEIPRNFHHELIGRTIEDSRRLYLETFGPDFPVDEFMTHTKKRVCESIERKGIPVKPGASDVLVELKRRNMCIVLASSSPRWMIDRNLRLSGMKSFFRFIISGEDVASGKPAPDIFLLAASSAAADPSVCVVLEDSNNGIRAAHGAGMRPVMVPDVKAADPDVQALVFRQYTDLHQVVRHLDEILSFRPVNMRESGSVR